MIGLIPAASANTDYLMTDEYSFEKGCVAAYSNARDKAADSNDWELLRRLTTYQNEIYLKHPSGYFKSLHIKAMKILHKQRESEQGPSYMDDYLKECGWRS